MRNRYEVSPHYEAHSLTSAGLLRDEVAVEVSTWLRDVFRRAPHAAGVHTTHNAASCIQMLDMLLAFRCGCKEERLHLNADAIRC